MHACEIETSYMLHLAPESVRMDKAIANYPEFPDDFGELAYRWSEFSASPVLGDAQAATAEKGAAFSTPCSTGWRKSCAGFTSGRLQAR